MKKNFTLFAASLLLVCFHCTILKAQFTNGQSASIVLGQPDFTSSSRNTTQNGMNLPAGEAIDKSGNLYLVDHTNNRILIYKNVISKTNGGNADYVLGQTNFISSGTSSSANGLDYPEGLCIDASGNLYIGDVQNRRVLIFKNITAKVNAGTLANGANADYVLGNTSFGNNGGGVAQNLFSNPYAICIDGSGNLYIADSYSYRVLIFKSVTSKVNNSTLSNGENADFVLGQPDFTSGGNPSGPTQNDMGPIGVVTDVSGNLYISDGTYNYDRILIFKNIVAAINAGTLSNDANANFVLGAPDFTTAGGNVTQNTFIFDSPSTLGGLATDASGNLYVSDQDNNRVLIFKNIAAKVTNNTLSNGANADIVLGQPDFTSSFSSTTINTMNLPAGLALDGADNLYEADYENSRVLRFGNSTLPVTLISFAANMADQSNVNLTWSTSSEENTSHFDLMRSTDGVHYSNIASVNAAGNSNIIRNYNYLDNVTKISFAGAIYYQLNEVDIDGKKQMSPVVLVKPVETSSGINLWPNPFIDHVQLSVAANAPKTIIVSAISTDGKIIRRQSYSLAKGENQISILNLDKLPAGIYHLVGIGQGKILFNKKTIKQ